MASFCLPYNSMLKNNIKHTHSGKPVNLIFREPNVLPTLEQIKQRNFYVYTHLGVQEVNAHTGLRNSPRIEEAQQYRDRLHRGKTSVYRNYAIPNAPALDRHYTSQEQVDEVVDRLRRGTVASQGIERDSEIRNMKARRESSSRFAGVGLRKMTQEEHDALVQRLTCPTHASLIRSEKDAHKVITEINHKIPTDSITVAKLKE